MSQSLQRHQHELVSSLTKRLESFLPNITGYSLMEVELNPQFIITRNVLVNNSKTNIDRTEYLALCFDELCQVLNSINKDSHDLRIRDKDEKVLASTLIVLKILSTLIKNYWSSKQKLSNFQTEYVSVNAELLTNYSFYYHFNPPKSLNFQRFQMIVDTLVELLSGEIIKRVVNLIQKRPIDSNRYYGPAVEDQFNDVSTESSSNNMSSLVNDIDLNIEICLRFIATANPVPYFNYIYDKLFKFNQSQEAFPIFALQRYSPLIKYTFYTLHNGTKMARAITKSLDSIRNTTWKQIILVFYASSVRDQAFSRPEDYDRIVESDPETSALCKSLFDQTVTIFEEFPYSGVSAMVLSWISVLNPSDYREHESKPNKLKVSFNKRLKFINSLIKDCSNKSKLSCFDSMVTLFHLAGRFPPEMQNHPIYQFSVRHLDKTYENLISLNPNSFTSNEQGSEYIKSSYDNLLANFYIASIMLKSDKYLDVLARRFEEVKDNFREIRMVIRVIRGLSESHLTTHEFERLMAKISVDLKSLIFNTAKFLSQCYENSIAFNSSSSSSSISIHSNDKVSVSSNSFLVAKNFDHELSPSPTRHGHQHSHSVLSSINDINIEDIKVSSASSLSSNSAKLISYTEDILSDLFTIFKAAPELFFNDKTFMNNDYFYKDQDHARKKIIGFVLDNINSLSVGLQSRSMNNENSSSGLFNSTLSLIMTMVDEKNKIATEYNEVTAFANHLTCNYIVKSICDSCLSLSLTDPRFKSSLLFLNQFLTTSESFGKFLKGNKILEDQKSRVDESLIGTSVERVLLLSLCTHDIQFYNIAKETMKWHIRSTKNPKNKFKDNLSETFKKIVDDDFVFTGFVSLHKRFRTILRDSKPTKSLYQIWVIIYDKWYDLLFNKSSSLTDENLLFRHFTGFLVSTSGCFLLNDFSRQDPELRLKLETYISQFFDKCIELLTSQDLVVRVIIKDALSNESHSAVYHLLSNKLTSIISSFEESKNIDEDSILLTEQAIMIITSMLGIPYDGAVVLASSLPESCSVIVKLINLVEDQASQLRLKLRFCKLTTVLETNRYRLLLRGAYKLRNAASKVTWEWLEQSAFYDEQGPAPITKSLPAGSIASGSTTKSHTRDSELTYLNIDLAAEASKALSLQLEELILEIPDGTAEKDIAKYKDLAFANYFSLFYKILAKHTLNTPTNVKSKYKVQAMVENVLKCVTNLLQYDTDIGLQFVFPLGYHENLKIRSLFLSVFADMLYERKVINKRKAEYSDSLLSTLGENVDIIRSSSVVASNNNQSLFASAVFGVYGYLKKLDSVFDILLNEEITNVSRTSDIFRRNSVLTKLLAKLAKDYGLIYLTEILREFVEEFTTNDIVFSVDKDLDSDADIDTFMIYLNKLVDLIVNSVDSMPKSFRYICAEIYKKVSAKVPDSGLIAVGSFIFLRFFCPAIISPESYFEIESINPNNKKSLLQLVKAIQNMANKTLSVLKWKSLNHKQVELEQISQKIFKFLEEVSAYDSAEYPFEEFDQVPIPEMRYLHKFYFNYFSDIKQQYLIGDFTAEELHRRVKEMEIRDGILKDLGQPKTLLAIQGGDAGGYKNFDPTGTLSSEYTEFMNRLSVKYSDRVVEVPLIHNSIFIDGTPVVVVNLSKLKLVDFDVNFLVYNLFETASQVWDNKFYFVFDFTEFSSEMHLLVTYATLLNSYGPSQLFRNCLRIYYFNLPTKDTVSFFRIVNPSKVSSKDARARYYTYSHCDSTDIISSLCLSDDTMAITKDKKVEFSNCKVLNTRNQTFYSSTVRIGRQYLLICSDDFVPTNHELCATKGFNPVEIYALSDITRCEITKASGATDEFTIYFNNEVSVIIRSSERLEILRFLYFTTSRLPKAFVEDEKSMNSGDITNLWFGRLFNIVFHSLLFEDPNVRSSASLLFASVSSYFDLDYSISKEHAKYIAYPANTTEFIVTISTHLAKEFPDMSYRFFRAFFVSYDKLPEEHRMNAILYISPWIDNVCREIYLEDEQAGPDRVAGVIRHFCSISSLNKNIISMINDYVWRKLFDQTLLIPLLLDEIVTFAMDNRNDDPGWAFIISVISPSVEICGETINRLINCINEATNNDSEIASESKLFEILILVKIAASLFFDSYIYAQLFLPDVFFICSLFIDNPSLEFGADLQNLMINTIQSFLSKPNLTEKEQTTVEETLTYFSGQRAKMLFGLTRDKSSSTSDITQMYNRAASFETLCDYLNDFITVLGSSDDRSGWRVRWCSYAINVAFTDSSLFQVRAILVVGILAKRGINDHTASKVLKLMSRSSLNNTLEYMTGVLMSASKIFQGLSKDSVLPSIIIWPELYFGMLNYSSLYQASIQCLLNTILKNFEQGLNYIDRIFEQRVHLATFIDEFEKSHGFHIDKANIVCYVFFIFTQGLKVSHIKHSSLMCLKETFRKRFDIEGGGKEGAQFEAPTGTLPYLYFIWLCSTESNFKDFLDSTSYKPSEWTDLGNCKIPSVVVEYLLEESIYSKLTLIQASYIYATPSVDTGFKTRFLYSLNYLFQFQKSSGLLIYHIISEELQNTLVNTNSTDLVVIISDIMVSVINDQDYSTEEYSQKADEFLEKCGMLVVKDYQFHKLKNAPEGEGLFKQRLEKDNERLQEMIYRSASSYVDNQRLEN